jgi:hypothetical protein
MKKAKEELHMKSRHYKEEILRKEKPEQSLDDALSQLKNMDASLQASAETRIRLLEALRSQNRRLSTKFWMKVAAVFLLSLFCGALWILKTEPRQSQRAETNTKGEVEPTNGYLPLTYGLTPEESLQTVRVKLPRSALQDLGISLNKIRSDEVTADLLVGESGLPYAIRVVQQN